MPAEKEPSILNLPVPPRRVVLPRFDTFGDLVLLGGLLSRLLERLPQTEFTLLVSEHYESIAPLFSTRIRWIATPLHHGRSIVHSSRTALVEFVKILRGGAFDAAIFTTFSRTWLDLLAAAVLEGIPRLALGTDAEGSPELRTHLREEGINPRRFFDYAVPVLEETPETDKYQALSDFLWPSAVPLPSPSLIVPRHFLDLGAQIAQQQGLTPGRYLVCVPTATPAYPFKAWRSECFVEVILQIRREFGLEPLLAGHANEREKVEKVARQLAPHGVKPAMWLGETGTIPILAGLLCGSALYCGNDTGPMHLAAGLSIPTVGIFGGGHWPRFLPVNRRAVAVAVPLPCYGCHWWDCVYGDGRCVDLVSVQSVLRAVRLVLGRKEVPVSCILSVPAVRRRQTKSA